MNYVAKLTKNSRVINILIAVQLAVVFAIIMIMLSAIENRTIYYRQFKEPLSKSGAVIMPRVINPQMASEEDILKIFDKATSVTCGKATFLTINSTTANTSMDYGYVVTYTDQLMKDIPPFLKEGKYPDPDSKVPQCLVCQSFGYKIGDTLEVTDFDGNPFKMEICGILADDQNIYGTGGPDYYDYIYDYRDFYYQLHSEMRETPMFLTTEDIITKAGSRTRTDFYSLTIVNFPEGAYTNEELVQMGADNYFQLWDSNENYYKASQAYVNQELYTLFPIALSILVITIFTAIITTMITTMNNLKNYAVLYLCGATWKRCSVINMLNFCLISALTAILDIIFFAVGKYTYLKETVVNVNFEKVLICIGILVLFVILSAIVPLLVVRKRQPRDVLKTEFRQ